MKLADGLKQLGLTHKGREYDLLLEYLREISLWNPRYGLVNTTDEGEIIVKHFLDSLAALPVMTRTLGDGLTTLADVGSGAGLPGIPLAIFRPDVKVTLIEKQGKRCRFLENVRLMLGLNNVEIFEGDVAEVKHRFSAVTFRAFSALTPELVTTLFGLLEQGGRVFSYKGRAEVFGPEMAAVQHLTGFRNVVNLAVPGLDEERHLIVLGPLPAETGV